MKILVLNNYDLARVAGEVAAGQKPAHHLYGVDGLRARGWKVETIPLAGGRRGLDRLGKFLAWLRWPVPLGDLGQQAEAWRRRAEYDAIYAPCQTQTQALSYARALGWLKIPLVTLAHHPREEGRLAWLRRPWWRLQLRGTDRFPALSARVADKLKAAQPDRPAGAGEFAPVLAWGPALDYYDRFRQEGPGDGAVAAGRTGRDWLTFGRAATLAGTPARIVCLHGEVGPGFAAFGPSVDIVASASEEALFYPQLLPLLARARVLAIPLAPATSLAGLTSLTDALGLGKPVIMTRHPLIDLDLEAEGIGRWVEPGDVEGWRAALAWFDAHPREAQAMGARARAVAETRWNYRRFTDAIAEILEAVGERR